jgi:hypothetical protein
MSTGAATPSSTPSTTIGAQLWRSLPRVYRTRDDGDFAALVDVFGGLLDRVRATLDQRLADSFPGNPAPGEDPGSAQPWLLPYFAQLVDAHLRSPHAAGRRLEVDQAIDWRKRKGTLGLAQDIAEAIVGPSEAGDAGRQVAVQEGFTRVATSARIGLPTLPPAAFGEPDPPPAALASPAVAARLPGLPAAFLDMRQISRAVQCPPDHPGAQRLDFAQASPVTWRQLNPRGAPCFPGSFEDRSPRTVDIRPSRGPEGQAEPRRVLLFTAPALGLFDPRLPLAAATVQTSVTLPSGGPLSGQRIGTLTVNGGSLALTGSWIDTLVLTDGARAQITGSAVRAIQSTATPDTSQPPNPVVSATDSLFETVSAAGLVRLVYCTVLAKTSADALQASDCVFADEVALPPSASGCVRYSRAAADVASSVQQHGNTAVEPVFLELPACASGDPTLQVPAWGRPGCGVLDVATPASIRFGAEDGGEMGAYHAFALWLEDQAVVDKATEHLPLAVTPALISDERLLHVPPAIESP